MLHTESKYLNLVAHRLERFRQRGPYLWVFRCPVCGDSKKSRSKTRAYAYEIGGKLRFYCHNCSASMTVPKLIRTLDESLYLEYCREEMESPSRAPEKPVDKPTHVARFDPRGLTPIKSLEASHPAVQYLISRRIPHARMGELFWASRFYEWASGIVPEKYDPRRPGGRIVIPFLGRDRLPTGFQGRSVDGADPKYVYIAPYPDKPLLYGLERVDLGREVLALEGPFDAMFLPNAVASGGGNIQRALEKAEIDPRTCVVVYDNESRNPHIVDGMVRAVKNKYRICVWPESVRHKDVNDMVLAGMGQQQVAQIIAASTVDGPAAIAAIGLWRRC